MNQVTPASKSNQVLKTHWVKPPVWWDLLGSPLRPSDEDLTFLRQTVLTQLPTQPDLKNVVILGVTPEIALLPWPETTEVLAIDSSPTMIRTVWPDSQVKRGEAICGSWQHLPIPDDSCDLVMGDGCFTLLDYPNGYERVLSEVLRVLRPDGLLSMRFFLNSSQREDVQTVIEDLKAKSIDNFHVFKFRLAMALQDSLETGVPIKQVWQTWKHEFPQPEQLFEELGWPMNLLETMNMYENSPSTYSFPSLAEIRSLFSKMFTEENCYFPNYEFGDRCPTILFRAKK